MKKIIMLVAADDPKWTDIDFPDSKFSSLAEVVQGAIQWLAMLLGVLAVIAIIYSGIMYITSAGDPTKAENAKKNLTWAIIGVVISLLAYFIVAEIKNIIG